MENIETNQASLCANGRIIEKGQIHGADGLMSVLCDATPFGVQFWDKELNLIDCNKATVNLLNLSSKQEYLDRFGELSPDFQPDGSLSKEAAVGYVKKAFEEGYQRVEWMYKTLDGELIPSEMTLVRIDYSGDSLVAAYVRDLREQKRMLQEINDTAAQLKAVVANYPGAICSADKNYNITLFDGLLVPHLVDKDLFFEGQDLHVALQKDEFKHIMVNLMKTIDEKAAQEWSFEANSKTLHMTTTPIFDDSGVVTGLVAKIEDITEMTRI